MAQGEKNTYEKLKKSFKKFDVQDFKDFLQFLSEVEVSGLNTTKQKSDLKKFQKQVGDFKKRFIKLVFDQTVKMCGGDDEVKRLMAEKEEKKKPTNKAATTTDNTTTPKEKK